MKNFILFMMILFSFKCNSQSTAKKLSFKESETIIKKQNIIDSSKVILAQNRPVLSHFGIKSKGFIIINDSLTLKPRKKNKGVKPKLLKYSKNVSNNN